MRKYWHKNWIMASVPCFSLTSVVFTDAGYLIPRLDAVSRHFIKMSDIVLMPCKLWGIEGKNKKNCTVENAYCCLKCSIYNLLKKTSVGELNTDVELSITQYGQCFFLFVFFRMTEKVFFFQL